MKTKPKVQSLKSAGRRLKSNPLRRRDSAAGFKVQGEVLALLLVTAASASG
jgi:hypothetical protein